MNYTFVPDISSFVKVFRVVEVFDNKQFFREAEVTGSRSGLVLGACFKNLPLDRGVGVEIMLPDVCR